VSSSEDRDWDENGASGQEEGDYDTNPDIDQEEELQQDGSAR
jgi:hypothetical protein